jgi:NAD(P)-dependent dehydrogenase (short-subunit alcohol dehydrogenase family)
MYQQRSGSILYMGSVHSKEASMLKAPYVTAKHGLLGLAKVVAKEGAEHGVRANVICPGFVRTPLVDKQIPEPARALGISEQAVIKDIMLKETVDGEFTTTTSPRQRCFLHLLNRARSPAITGCEPWLVHAIAGAHGIRATVLRPYKPRLKVTWYECQGIVRDVYRQCAKTSILAC